MRTEVTTRTGAAGVDWIGLEPDPAARRRLATIAAAHGYHRPVMASVADQAVVLAQVRRVLRPSGQFVFFEHVAAPAFGLYSHYLGGTAHA